MPNIKSQKKRALTNLKANAANKSASSELKTAIKAVLAATDKETANKAYNHAVSLLDKAVSSGLHHKNYASRQKARLAKVVNSIGQN